MKKNEVDERLKESLSAVIDGEANELEFQRVMNNLENNELRRVAKSYQLIGDVLGKEHTRFAKMDISKTVAEKIGNETRQPKNKKLFDFIHSGMGKVAVAASVTLAVIIGIRSWNGGDDTPLVPLTQNNMATTQSTLSANVPEHTQDYGARGLLAGVNAEQPALTPGQMNVARSIANLQTLERFKSYSLNHAEFQATRNIGGILSLVRAAGFQSK